MNEFPAFRLLLSAALLALSASLAAAAPVDPVAPAAPPASPAPAGRTLEECITYAREHSRDLAKRRIELDGSRLDTGIAWGKFRPGVTLAAEDSQDDGPTTATGALKQEAPGGLSATVSGRSDRKEDDEGAAASIRLSKVLLGGGSWAESMLEIDNSKLDTLIAANRLNLYQRELAYDVKKRFYLLIRSRQTLRINELRVEQARKNLEHALERQRPLDIATAKIEVPENEAAVLRAQRQIASALDDLKTVIGMDVSAALEVDTSFRFAEQALRVEEDIAFSIENSEDLLNVSLLLKKAGNELPVQRARRWPKLTLSATAGRENDEGMDLGGSETETALGLAVSWELGGKTERLRTDRLEKGLKSLEIDLVEARQQKIKTIRDLGRRVAETLNLVRLQEQKVAVATQRVELYQDRWNNGEIDILEFIRAQNELENSRIQSINLQTEYMELVGQYDLTVGR
jgi:outer membrane protein TolC